MNLLSRLVKSPKVISISSEETVSDAVDTMVKNGVGSVLILDNNKLSGIFTERDLLKRVVGKGLDVKTTLISQVMTTSVHSIPLTETIEHSYKKMHEIKSRRLPITDNNRVVGMITMRNILEWLIQEIEAENVQLKNYIQTG